MADQIATRASVLNYSGLLYDKGDNRTPLLSVLRNRRSVTNHKDFVVGQYFTSPDVNAQPEITEIESLTAPDAKIATRTQMENCTQIFQESVYVSYAKESDMGSLAGLNVVGQTGAPANELDFQVGVTMGTIQKQIEYTVVNGVYQKAVDANTAGKTRGFIAAITTNVDAKVGSPTLKYYDIVGMMQKIADAGNAPTSGLTLVTNSTNFMQLLANCEENSIKTQQLENTTYGIDLTRIITPFGNLDIMMDNYVPKGTALILNLDVAGLKEQVVPGKGNFFYEELAKTGAGTKGEIFGQLGLDHGPEWYHGKITGLATTFTAPDDGKLVRIEKEVKANITNTTSKPVNTKEVG